MSMSSERGHNTLNKKQLRLLILSYKFRFITAPLLTEYLGLKSNSVIRNLHVLVNQHYLGRQYDTSYKMDRKPAVYFLDKKGLALLKAKPYIQPHVLHSYYKNWTLSEGYIHHHLDVLAGYLALHAIYDTLFEKFSRSEVRGFGDIDNFPEPTPDLFLRHAHGGPHYLLLFVHDLPLFIVKKHLTRYIEHSENGNWDWDTYPTLLFVLETRAHEQQFRQYASKTLENIGIELSELPIATTTLAALTTKPYQPAIWTFVGTASLAALA